MYFVAAEVDVASGNFDQGRAELQLAQELEPGLPFAAPASVRALEDKLSQAPLAHILSGHPTAAAFPSGLAVVVIGICVVAAFIVMRRRAPSER